MRKRNQRYRMHTVDCVTSAPSNPAPPLPRRPFRWRRHTVIALSALLVVLVAARIAAPILIKGAIDRRLDKIPGYSGKVEGITLHVWRGAYRIDGMFTHLRLAGILPQIGGLVLGLFDHPNAQEQTRITACLQREAKRIDVPCVSGAPIGHFPGQIIIPQGAPAELDAGKRTLKIKMQLML